MQDSIFSKIINKQLPAEIVYEDSKNIAILSINPNSAGHTLVIPKKQVDQFTDIDSQTFLNAMELSQKLARVLKNIFTPARVGLVIEGFAVPHLHIHLIPMNKPGDLDHDRAGSANLDELKRNANKIRDFITKNGID